MRVSNILSGALALAGSCSAFFPWYPDYRCAETKDCVEVKASTEGLAERGNGLSMRVVQKIAEEDDFSLPKARTLAEQLRRKYRRGSSVKEANARSLVAKRTNTYTVMAAATPTQESSAGIDQDGTDFSYFAQVQLGSTNAPIYLLLDTGADSSWVMGNTCSSAPCLVHDLYDPTTSTTFSALGESFSIQYGSGSVSGVLGTEDLTLAGMKIPIALGIANVTSTDFNNFPMDGILGLSLAKSSTPSFLDSLAASKALKSNIFGISLNRASDGPNTGEINFGAPDTSRYSGDLAYTSVSTAGGGFWSIPMANVGFGTAQAGITTKLAYIDTGTTYIFCDSSDAQQLHSIIPGATTTDNSTWHVPCSTTTSITFTFGSSTYSVSSKDWISPPSSGVCTSNIYGHDIIGGQWLLGDTFLKNVYAVFDADESRVGFAQEGAVAKAIVTSSASIATATSNPSGTAATVNSATFTATETASGSSASTTSTSTDESPGLEGHETANSNSGTAADQTSASSSPTAAAKSSGRKVQSSLLAALIGLVFTVMI